MARAARSPEDRCTLSSPCETQRRLWILGGGDQLRAGTMFLATLYFALPLLGKSRLPVASPQPQSLSKRVPCSGHSRIAAWVSWMWVQSFVGGGGGERFEGPWAWEAVAAQPLRGWFYLLC